ncbi:galectin 17 [Leuresthes tenuis]|uniref:galectin 17 n=1 Tax=Leuresthes tenuis TaxID=355514 RepID=UPI003B512526
MKKTKMGFWFFILLQCFLTGNTVDSSSLSSASRTKSIMSTVGDQVVLPCSWKSGLGEVAPSACHVQWVAPPKTIFEQRGKDVAVAEKFMGRLEVPEKKLESGDCSLIMKDVQIGDTGRYESFIVVDGAMSRKERLFIQSVKLFVIDHKSEYFYQTGEDLVLELHSQHAFRVVFQGRNSSEWSDLWMRGDKNSQRLEKHPLQEKLTMKKIKSSDEGTYKVLDEQGLAVSTVQLYVEENSLDFRVHQRLEYVPTGAAAKSSHSPILLLSVLVSSFQILHLL